MSLDAYEVLDELGRGAMGRVFRARHRPTGAVRAVKVMDGVPDAEALARFEREAGALARAGAGAVRIHEFGVAGRRLFFVMDLLAGGSLRDRVKRAGGKLPWAEAVALGADLAGALGRCHAAGLVHRDLKPENVLLDEEGRPFLADFGCARDLAASTLTETGTVLGTPAYMAPEQLRGEKVDARADVFALGAILYELVAGARPYDGRSLVQLHEQASAGRFVPASERADAPAALDAVIARALAPDPAKRFNHGFALEAALRSLLDGGDAKMGAAPRSRATFALVAGATAAVAALGLAVALRAPAAAPAPATSPASRAPTPAPAPIALGDLAAAATAGAARGALRLAAEGLARGTAGDEADLDRAWDLLAPRDDPSFATLYVRTAFARAPELRLETAPSNLPSFDEGQARSLRVCIAHARALVEELALVASATTADELAAVSKKAQAHAAKLAERLEGLRAVAPVALRPLFGLTKVMPALVNEDAIRWTELISAVAPALAELRGYARFVDALYLANCPLGVGEPAAHAKQFERSKLAEEVAPIDSLLAASLLMVALTHALDQCPLENREVPEWSRRCLELELAATEQGVVVNNELYRRAIEVGIRPRVSNGSPAARDAARGRLATLRAAADGFAKFDPGRVRGLDEGIVRTAIAADALDTLDGLPRYQVAVWCVIDGCRAARRGDFGTADAKVAEATKGFAWTEQPILREARAYIDRERERRQR